MQEVADVGDTVELINTLERLLHAAGERSLADQLGPIAGQPVRAGHCNTPLAPRLGMTPRKVSALASRSLPVLSQRS